MVPFLVEFIKHPRFIGAVAPSGRALAEKMMGTVRFDRARAIVEYGSGTGVFTRRLLARRREDTKLILIENNPVFYCRLQKEFGGQRDVYLFCGSAEDVNDYLAQCGISSADFIVSGLPFASLPKQMSENILSATCKALGKKGRFITFQYSMVRRKFFERYFSIDGRLLEMKNLPPAYVLVMRAKKLCRGRTEEN
ncbi:MAG: SAM-dependent methyltransferase [Lachnospiraceae bacterium]|nr:SAM-dependent methyltransferase [Lachnospiraceae bacterium]